MMQPRFDRRSGNSPFTLVEQARFRAGFDFLRLRADAGEIADDLASWWEDFSQADDESRRELLQRARPQPAAPRRVRAKPPAAAPADGATPEAPAAAGARVEGDEAGGEGADAESPADPVKRRRRRRRKPAAPGTSEGDGEAPARAETTAAPAAE